MRRIECIYVLLHMMLVSGGLPGAGPNPDSCAQVPHLLQATYSCAVFVLFDHLRH